MMIMNYNKIKMMILAMIVFFKMIRKMIKNYKQLKKT